MPFVKELQAETQDFANLTTSAKLDLGSKRTVKLKYKQPSKVASLEAVLPGLTVNYDFKTKDIELLHKRDIKLGALSIKQRLPNQQLYLFPSPEVKLTSRPRFLQSGTKLRWETGLTYDFQKSVAKVEHEVTVRGKYKAVVNADTANGPRGASLALTVKPGKRLTSVGVTLSRSNGPVLKAEGVIPKDGSKAGVRVKGEYRVKSKDAKLELESPSFLKKKLRVTATSTVRLSSAVKRPTLLLNTKLEL